MHKQQLDCDIFHIMSKINWETELKKAYEMGIEMGILSDMVFEDFLNTVDVGEIEQKAEEAREKKTEVDEYLRKNGATDEFMMSRDDWINNYEFRAIGYSLIMTALNLGRGFEVDWKANEADIVNKVKSIEPRWNGNDWKNGEISDGRVLVQYDTQGDSMGFLLVPKDIVLKYLNNKYIKLIS